MKECTRQDHELFEIIPFKDALLDSIGNRLSDRRLQGPEDLVHLRLFLQGHLRDDQGCGLCHQVRANHCEQRRVAHRELRERIGKGYPDRSALFPDDEIDMRKFCAVAYQCFSDEIHVHGLRLMQEYW
ncbi:hypothetical protein ASZ90_009000 [hydrocarbon metagenome]|uniref:Uncharacterized protein n=1 Tax=hydrocarbon metagenome TaxID=938273 RepID=A0A0W8FK12_9ZZZZ